MTAPAPRTFRDFASEVFAGDLPAAAASLTELLGLEPGPARAAAEHFHGQLTDPTFVPKAMSLRAVVEGPDDQAIQALLSDCFGLDAAAATAATAALRSRYPRP
jgi:hypothetical protein